MARYPFSINPKHPDLLADYISRNLNEALYGNSPNQNGLDKQIETASFPLEKRQILRRVVEKKYDHYNSPKPFDLSIIERENTFCITTGHQLCLLGGPQFFMHKIASVVALVKTLNQQNKDKQFFSVFWLASEDHDVEEINRLEVGEELFQSENTSKTAVVGRMKANVFRDVIHRVINHLPETSFKQSFINTLPKIDENKTWGAFYFEWLAKILSPYGVLIVDGDEANLKNMFASVMQNELTQNITHQNVISTNQKLGHYHKQAYVRDINLFYLQGEKRGRIEQDGQGFKIVNGSMKWTRKEILKEVENHSNRFSPNVFLRPVYQEIILPNIAYIGGGGEVAYWLQLKSTFDAFGVNYPVVLLRESFLWVNKSDKNHLENLNLTIKDLFLPQEKLIENVLKNANIDEFDMAKNRGAIQDILNDVQRQIIAIDKGLKQMAKGSWVAIEKTLDKVQSKMNKAIKNHHRSTWEKVVRLQQIYLPNGLLNERKNGCLDLWNEMGFETYFQTLLNHSDAINTGVQIIEFD